MQNKDEFLREIGSRIKAERKKAKLTQEEVGYSANLSRSYYSGIERGVRNVSSINLMAIAVAINVEVGNFFPTVKEVKIKGTFF